MINFDTKTNIIDGSLGKFSLTPIEKCYNTFTINYNKIADKYTKTISIQKVDQDAFPEPTEYTDPVFGNPIPVVNNLTTWDIKWVQADQRYIMVLFNGGGFNDDLFEQFDVFPNKLRRANTTTIDIDFTSVIEINSGPLGKQYELVTTSTQTVDTDYECIDVSEVDSSKSNTVWSTDYVTGIKDYVTAKDLWTICHESWVANKRIRICPTDRTNLEFAVDMDSFNGVVDPSTGKMSIYADTDEYAYLYTLLFISWVTRQKLTVNFDIPVTSETIKYELLDRCEFRDDLLTPHNEYGKGTISAIQLNPKKSLINITVIFDVFFMTPQPPISCTNYWETGVETDPNIIEDQNNVDNIIEPCI